MSKEKVKELKKKIEALVIAIPRELEAYEFYLDLAERSEDLPSKEMFMFLAKQELAHRDHLERILNDLQTQLEEELKK
ncbi:MAG: rubrerythrin [Nitrospinae bacterium]|nr:rubrerythrin [Nitrospinota bacterium]